MTYNRWLIIGAIASLILGRAIAGALPIWTTIPALAALGYSLLEIGALAERRRITRDVRQILDGRDQKES